MSDYHQFLSAKIQTVESKGFDVPVEQINSKLFLFQRDIVRWALRLGRAALFEECGMGKTFQFLEWAKAVQRHTNGKILILEPLAVAPQTIREARKLDLDVRYAKDRHDIGDAKLIVTNYERMHLFLSGDFDGVVLDESSILKSFMGKTKRMLVEAFSATPFKLACTATPAPNDHMELGNHAEFLGVMPSNEMLSRWFINDTMKSGSYRLKNHARKDFWRWLTSYAVCLSTPGDLGPGYEMPDFDLPALNLHEYRLAAAQETIARSWAQGMLLPDTNPSSTTLHKVKRESLQDRVRKAQELVEALPDEEPVVIWCDTNYEADALLKAFPKAIEVRGNHSQEQKESRLNAFSEGKERLLITKPDIAGFGLNWQHCSNMVFVGVSFSFEKTYQALRRSYRFGQTKPVHAHMIYAETEGNVIESLKRKQSDFAEMQSEMNVAMHEHGLFRDVNVRKLSSSVGNTPMSIPSWLYSKGVA